MFCGIMPQNFVFCFPYFFTTKKNINYIGHVIESICMGMIKQIFCNLNCDDFEQGFYIFKVYTNASAVNGYGKPVTISLY